MDFKEVTAEDAKWAKPLLEENGFCSCEFAFVNVFMWSKVYNTKITRMDDFFVARSDLKRFHYLYPAGHGDIKKVFDEMINETKKADKQMVVFSLNEEAKAELEKIYPEKFIYEKEQGEADYIYLASDLAQLKGKKYQKKRNHCSRFERTYLNWQFHEITPDVIDELHVFNDKWCNLYDNRGDEGIREERRAIQLVFDNYDELCIKGGYITVDDEIVAFSFGSALGKDFFVTHVEKALYDVMGAYNMINREMAKFFCQDKYKYINRENDLNEEGLRDAKLSYKPIFIEEKYTAELIRD